MPNPLEITSETYPEEVQIWASRVTNDPRTFGIPDERLEGHRQAPSSRSEIEGENDKVKALAEKMELSGCKPPVIQVIEKEHTTMGAYDKAMAAPDHEPTLPEADVLQAIDGLERKEKIRQELCRRKSKT